MNLAEIRKKAGEVKKAEEANAPVPEFDNHIYENDKAEWIGELPDMVSDSAGLQVVLPEGGVTDSSFLIEDDLDYPVPVEAEDETARIQKQSLVSLFENNDEVVVDNQAVPPLAEVDVSSGVYDPLAMLLDGRRIGACGEETSSVASQAIATSDIEEYLCFRVADEMYALSIMTIKEIIKPRDVTEVPRMPGFISGVISLRGVIIPVMDMRMRLSLPVGEKSGRERIIVLSIHAGFCGVLVDEVIQVVRIHCSAIEDPPAVLDGIDREFVKGLGRVDNRMLILLNLESILDLGIH